MPIPRGCVLDNLIGKPKATDKELVKSLRDIVNQSIEEYTDDLGTQSWSQEAWAEEFFAVLCAVAEAFEYGLLKSDT